MWSIVNGRQIETDGYKVDVFEEAAKGGLNRQLYRQVKQLYKAGEPFKDS